MPSCTSVSYTLNNSSLEKQLRDYDLRHLKCPREPKPSVAQQQSSRQRAYKRPTSSLYATASSNSSDSFREEIIRRVSVEPIKSHQFEDSFCGMMGVSEGELAELQADSDQDINVQSHYREGHDRPMSRLGRGTPSDIGSVASLEIWSK